MAGTQRSWRQSVEQRRDDRQARLLAAGLREFGGRGYHASTVLGLCASARVSARDFYAAFGSREALFVAVYRQQVGAALHALVAAVDGAEQDGVEQDGLDDVVRRSVGAYLDHLQQHPLAARVVHREVLGVGALLETERRRAIALFEAALDQRLAAVGGVPAGTGLGIVGVVNETISSELHSHRPDLPGRIEPLTLLVTRLLTPGPLT